MTFSSSQEFIDRLESTLYDFKEQNKGLTAPHSSALEEKMELLIKEVREAKGVPVYENNKHPEYASHQQNMQQQPMQMPLPQQPFSNDSDAREIDKLRRKMLRMEDRMYDMYNRSMQQQPGQMPPQQQDKTLYYLLLIIGSVAFLYMPIVGIPLLAGAVASASGNKNSSQDIQNYLNSVHQNQHFIHEEIHNLKGEISKLNRNVSRNSRGM